MEFKRGDRIQTAEGDRGNVVVAAGDSVRVKLDAEFVPRWIPARDLQLDSPGDASARES